MCKCVFFIGGNQIENVDSFSHLVTLLIPDSLTIKTYMYYSGVIHLQCKQVMFCVFLGN